MSTDKVCPVCKLPQHAASYKKHLKEHHGWRYTSESPNDPVPPVPTNHEAEELTLRQQIYDVLNDHVSHKCLSTRKNPCAGVTHIEALLTQQRTAAEQAEYERGKREASRITLNELNQELFHSTANPDGQFIKDVLMRRLNENQDIQPPQSGEKL